MARSKAWNETHFLMAVPEGEDRAITTQEIADKLGCSRALASRNLANLVNKGSVFHGKPGEYGRLTYYVQQRRPDLMLPYFQDMRGISRSFLYYLELMTDETRASKELGTLGCSMIFPIVANYALAALGFNNAPSVEDTRIPAEIHHHIMNKIVKNYQEMSDSIRYDLVLENGPGPREDMAATIRAKFDDTGISEEELLALANKWRFAR